MARKGIQYGQVVAAIETLQEERIRITVRAIHARTGGSMSTVLKHYRQWQFEQSGAPAGSPEISPRLADALRDEFQNHVRSAVQTMEKRLQAKSTELERTRQTLADRDRELQRSRDEIRQMTERIDALEEALQTSDTRAAEAETKLQERRRQSTLKPQRKSSPPPGSGDTPPESDPQQEAFEF